MLFSNNASPVAVVCMEATGRDPCAGSLNPGKLLSWSDRGSMEQRWEDRKVRVDWSGRLLGSWNMQGCLRVLQVCAFVHSPLWGPGSGEQPACSGGPGYNGFEKLC